MNAQERRLVNLYRNSSGIAVVTGRLMYELSTSQVGYRIQDSERAVSFIRDGFERIRNTAWIKRMWRKQHTARVKEFRAIMSGYLAKTQRTAILTLITEGWTGTWGQLRTKLASLTAGTLTKRQCIALRNKLWAMRALQFRLSDSFELYDLDKPLLTRA